VITAMLVGTVPTRGLGMHAQSMAGGQMEDLRVDAPIDQRRRVDRGGRDAAGTTRANRASFRDKKCPRPTFVTHQEALTPCGATVSDAFGCFLLV
jgi:hypothetical protein